MALHHLQYGTVGNKQTLDYSLWSTPELLAEMTKRTGQLVGDEMAKKLAAQAEAATPWYWGSEIHRGRMIQAFRYDDRLCEEQQR